MKDKIIDYLTSLEKEKEIEILLACETGSRAWGFPSPDSDYDVRVIYKHHQNWYLSLTDKKDSIDLMLDDNEIDISGWDLRKGLRLLWKSNPAFLERLQSPIVYKRNEKFVNEILPLAESCYSKIATMHHYLNLARKCYKDIATDKEYKLKRFFYCLRSSIACKWILDRDEMPPILFKTMVDKLAIEENIKRRINELIHLKSFKNEDYLHSGEVELIQFMNALLHEAQTSAKSLPPSKADMKDLEAFFLKTIL